MRIRTVASGLAFPWSIAFAGATRALVVERPGRVREIRGGRLLAAPIAGVPVVENLLDVAIDPAFSATSRIYLSYLANRGGATRLEVVRVKLAGSRLRESRVVFAAEPALRATPFSGGRMLFLPDLTLLISVGDAQQSQSRAQDLRSNLGTTVRINRDGSVPRDNPFRYAAQASADVYTYGHRNVLGMALNARSGEVWAVEHGPEGGDELNILRKGANYGWPLVGHAAGTVAAIRQWTPALAPSGAVFYEGNRFPQWHGNLFMGSLSQKHLRRLEVRGNAVAREEALLQELGERIRDVRVGPDGYLYVLTDSADGRVLRLEPAPAQKRLASHSSRSTSDRAAPRSPSSCTRR